MLQTIINPLAKSYCSIVYSVTAVNPKDEIKIIQSCTIPAYKLTYLPVYSYKHQWPGRETVPLAMS